MNNKWTKKSQASCLSGVITIFLIQPIWYYLLYTILKAINPSSLTWFLFWAYVPLTLILRVLIEITTQLFVDEEK